MADKSELQGKPEVASDQGRTRPVGEPQQGIFDARLSEVMDLFGEACERGGIRLAFAVAVGSTGKPTLFLRGHRYDVAELAGEAVRSLQDQLVAKLVGRA